MILHCTPPYRHDIPNAPLGYLKGFLETKGVPVQNVYWNLVLAEKLSKFVTISRHYSHFYIESTVVYICRHLLNRGSYSDNSLSTTYDQLFSSVFTREEISEMVASIEDDITHYVQQNNLHEATLSGFTLKTYQWPVSYYIINRLKEMNPDTHIVMGGIADEDQARVYMKIFDKADFAVWGEGEYPLYYLHEALVENTSLDEVPNLVYRDGPMINATRENNEYPPLDSYPFADHTDYFRAKKKFTPLNKFILIPIWGSRSCPWNKCKFCSLNENYQYRVRSPENVVGEVEFQSKKHHIDEFYFMDTDVAGNKKRFIKLLNLLMQSIKERRRPYKLQGEVSPVFLDAETAPYIRRAGFVVLQAGFEAVTDGLLQKMMKRHGFVHNIQVLKLGTRYNMPLAGLNIIRGIPPETEEDILQSRSNLRLLRFFVKKFYLEPIIFVLFKGSPFYEEMPEDEREEWKKDILWEEAVPLNLVPEPERFQFTGFIQEKFTHSYTWNSFENLLKFYRERDYSYEWIEGPDGSFVEEKGARPRKYMLSRDETDVLVFCDSIRKFSEVKEEFPRISEDALCRIMENLKNCGVLYHDESGRIISVLDATKKQKGNLSK